MLHNHLTGNRARPPMMATAPAARRRAPLTPLLALLTCACSAVIGLAPMAAAAAQLKPSSAYLPQSRWPGWPGPGWPHGGGGGGTSYIHGIPGAAPTVQVGGDPVGVVIDPANHTVYVANGGANTVSVINTATCNAYNLSGCSQTPTSVAIGSNPLSLVVDYATQTLYVTNLFANTVSMVNVSTCNAEETAGCSQVPPTVAVGNQPALLAIDQATNTVYVPNSGANTVSIINGATCNATVTSGCASTATLTVGPGPSAIAVNQQTNTVYVGNYNDGTVSVFNAATCGSQDTSGCGETPATVTVGPNPSALVVDEASNTTYVQVGGPSLGALAMINGNICNATDTAGCATAPLTTPVGSGPIWVTEDALTRTVYAVNQEDNDISVINATSCNATVTWGCRATPPALAIGGASAVIPSCDCGAGAVAVDPTTNTLYATSQAEDNVSILNGNTCDAFITWGCTAFSPTGTVGNGPQGAALDEATNTVYVANRSDNTVSVINSAVCNVEHLTGCDQVWPTVAVGGYPQAVAVDPVTDTVYVANLAGTVSVINGATCNSNQHSGCGLATPTVSVAGNPGAIAVNDATDTVYVGNQGPDATAISVINGAACNGTQSSGCSLPAITAQVGLYPDGFAIDEANNTVYVANAGGNSVSVIDGATCDGTRNSSCALTPPAVTVGSDPWYLALDQATSTVYVDNIGGNSLSLINSATCNAVVAAGCDHIPPTVAVEGLPSGVAVDAQTGLVYVTSGWDSDIATINAASCNATNAQRCTVSPYPLRLGGFPTDPVLVGAVGTAYVPDNGDGTVSLIGLSTWG